MSVEGPASGPPGSNAYDHLVATTARQHRLYSAHWELTYRCNEKCSHCYLDVFAPHAPVPGELTTAECLGILDQIAEMGALNLTLSGGEILVRRDFFEIAEHARTQKFLLRLFTNGILITPKIADRIAALHPYAVEISLYSVRPETHDAITGLGRSWELTVRALRLLHERGVRTLLKTPLMRETVHEVREIEAFAKDLGAGFHYDITITQKDSGGQSPLKHRLTDEDLLWLMRDQIDTAIWENRKVSDSTRTCGITLNSIAIDPYGNVTPCLQVRAAAGNLRERRLREIWEQSEVWERLGHLTLGELPVCRTCELNRFCVRCHGLAQAEDGSLTAPALVNCREALARRQVLIERGVLPADYPIPAHLRDYVAGESAGQISAPLAFVPLSDVTIRRQDRQSGMLERRSSTVT